MKLIFFALLSLNAPLVYAQSNSTSSSETCTIEKDFNSYSYPLDDYCGNVTVQIGIKQSQSDKDEYQFKVCIPEISLVRKSSSERERKFKPSSAEFTVLVSTETARNRNKITRAKIQKVTKVINGPLIIDNPSDGSMFEFKPFGNRDLSKLKSQQYPGHEQFPSYCNIKLFHFGTKQPFIRSEGGLAIYNEPNQERKERAPLNKNYFFISKGAPGIKERLRGAPGKPGHDGPPPTDEPPNPRPHEQGAQ